MLSAIPYRDRLTVTRRAAAAQDPATGVPVAAPAVTVLVSACDCQDDPVRIARLRLGDAYKDADAVLYVPSTTSLAAVQVGDDVVVDAAGTVYTGQVVATGRFGGKLVVVWS